ncbi:GNAT family N-acetyltransferase [Candidatus Enterococcus clewellii]|uniref:N-acetyltransferase domain-containing protein n=1 Tax=Candidatus Enterococcus clewellii TaxID=1834193 RepID=A0A242KBT3_9ENTE|nr:GNAT family N-acetyltransferase [Enterococcus sp. 9E7_DIV0242]OTP18612.1 hypothetical protein A5888_000426 [Enterococcus sp. 9E7_DIV0242]
MDYRYQKLEGVDTPLLYQTFLAAFSDYAVDLTLSYEDYKKMLERRGLTKHISIGAYQQSDYSLIGMILNGLREWQGKRTAYDLMTGVAPDHRKLGVTKKMFAEVLTVLKEEQVEQYLLEVLQENQAAVSLYKNQGFEITRAFSVFKGSKEELLKRSIPDTKDVSILDAIERLDWKQLSNFWDFQPSWQNSIASICAVEKAFCCVAVFHSGQIIGYGLIDKKTGDIPQLAVHRSYRRQGIGKSLVVALANQAEVQSVSMINVDDQCDEMVQFLRHLNFTLTTKQYEMMLTLKNMK